MHRTSALFAIALTILPLSHAGSAPPERPPPLITIDRDIENEIPLEYPWGTLFPLDFEERAVGEGREGAPILLSVTASTVRLQIQEGPEVVKYEGALADTPLAAALQQLSPGDLRGAFVLTNERIEDGTKILIRNRSGHFVFQNCSAPTLPDPFRCFAPVLAAYRETIAKRASLKVIGRESAGLRIIEPRPEYSGPRPGESILPLSIRREFVSPRGNDWFGVQISGDQVHLHMLEKGLQVLYSGRLADTALCAAVADLTREDLTRALRIYNPYREHPYDTVFNGPDVLLRVQGSGKDVLGDEFVRVQRVIDAFEELVAQKKGITLAFRGTEHQRSYSFEELPHIQSKLGPLAQAALPLRIERGTIEAGLRLPRDVLELMESGLRLFAIEGNTRATYEGSHADVEIAELLAAINPRDLAGAHRIVSGDARTGEYLVSNSGGLKSLRVLSSDDLREEFESLRLAILAFERTMKHRARLKLVRREPLPADASGPLSCTIRAAATCELGSAPKVEFELLNRSEDDLHLLGNLDGSEYLGRYPHCSVQCIRPDGSELPTLMSECGIMTQLTEQDFVKVPAGEGFDPFSKAGRHFRCCSINPENFSHPGEYRLRFVYSTESDDFRCWAGSGFEQGISEKNDKLVRLFRQIPQVTIVSNEILVTVAAPEKRPR